MNSSPQEDNSIPVKALGSNFQLDFDKAGAIVYTSNDHPVGVSTISSKVSDTCLINGGCSSISTLDTEDEKLLISEQIQQLDLGLLDAEYYEKIELFQVYLDRVKKIVRPGCSQELLNVALNSVSSLAGILTVMSSKPKLNASL